MDPDAHPQPPPDLAADPEGQRAADRAEDARLVAAVGEGDADAFGQLYDRWYDRVFELAGRITRDDARAADVAQDAFLAAWQRIGSLRDADAFGGWLLRITRNRALDGVRAEGRVQLEEQSDMSDRLDADAADRLGGLDDPAAAAEDREIRTLVLEAATALGERDASALHLHLRYGMAPAEIGEVLGINRNAANQLVHRMKDRLGTAVRSRVLWRDGRPVCAALARELDDRDVDTFDARTVRLADRHAADCEECDDRRRTRLAPSVLFRGVPLAAAPVAFKARAAEALAAEGVPMDGSAFGPGGPGLSDGSGPDAGSTGDTTGTAAGATVGAAAGIGPAPGSTRRRAVARGAAVVAVIAALVAGLFAFGPLASGDQGAKRVVAPRAAPTTTSTVVTTTVVTTTVPSTTIADEPPADLAPDPVPPAADEPAGGDSVTPVDPAPPPPPPPPPAPTGNVAVSPGTAPGVYAMGQAPVVSWSSTGGDSVTVTGPGLSSGAASGTQGVCPGFIGTGSVCQASPGSYSYVLTVTGAGGTAQYTATLVIA